VTAHEQTDRELQQAKEHAEAANNAKSRYLTGISHELRSPLNTVLGYAQLMEMDEHTTEQSRRRVAIIRQNGQHLADLIEGLLDISKIEAGRLEIQRNHIQFGALMEQIAQMFSDQAAAKGLAFSYICESKLPEYVNGDEKRLRQILINLLTNAVKFTPSGAVELTLKYRNEVAEFKVSDTGIGIPESERERIFKPFERVRGPGQPSVPGTGLGLTITQLLTEIMGGEISVSGNPAGGATFTVWLMLSSVPNAQLAPKHVPRRIVGYRGRRRSLLVVDDDPSHRGLFGDLLNPLGFAVVEAPDGPTCLDMVSQFTPDLFIVDRRMPGMDGFSLIEELQRAGITKPIVMVSANANEDTKREASEAVYHEYLVKPVRLDKLLEILAHHLNLAWKYEAEDADTESRPARLDATALPDRETCRDILHCIEIGHLNRLKDIAASLHAASGGNRAFVRELSSCIRQIRYDSIVDVLRERCS
jgi:CheY-like chemotaxis protein